jgi:hypothetical protein
MRQPRILYSVRTPWTRPGTDSSLGHTLCQGRLREPRRLRGLALILMGDGCDSAS